MILELQSGELRFIYIFNSSLNHFIFLKIQALLVISVTNTHTHKKILSKDNKAAGLESLNVEGDSEDHGWSERGDGVTVSLQLSLWGTNIPAVLSGEEICVWERNSSHSSCSTAWSLPVWHAQSTEQCGDARLYANFCGQQRFDSRVCLHQHTTLP